MQIIVDGSQLRLDPKDIQNYLNKGYIVTNRSKYFTGPPYSGALLLPGVSKSIHSAKNKLPKVNNITIIRIGQHRGSVQMIYPMDIMVLTCAGTLP
jgi:hypothetical protein